MFEEEATKPENSKVEGHTLIAGMEGVMKDNGIEFGEFRAGDIQGNGCRKLMSCGGEITKYMAEFLQSMPAGQKNCSDEEIGESFGVYAPFLLDLPPLLPDYHYLPLSDAHIHQHPLQGRRTLRYFSFLAVSV